MRNRYCLQVGQLRLWVLFALSNLSIFSFVYGQNFDKTYTDYPDYWGEEVLPTSDGYILVSKVFPLPNYAILELNVSGNLTEPPDFVDLPQGSVSSFNSNSVRLSNGNYIVAHIDDTDFNDIPPFVFFNEYDSEGRLIHSFEIELPENRGIIYRPSFEELPDGTVFLMFSHAEEPTTPGPPINSYIVSALYDPVTQTLLQENSLFWSAVNFNIRIPQIEVSLDGTFFVHIHQVDLAERHIVAKVNVEGEIIWSEQVSTLARPVIDMVPTEDGGVWFWIHAFSSLYKYDADGNQEAEITYNAAFWPTYTITGIGPAADNGVSVVASNGTFLDGTLVTGVFDSSGNLLEENIYDDIENLFFVAQGFATPDGGYAFVGRRSVNDDIVPALVKLNAQGQILQNGDEPDLNLFIIGTDENPDQWNSHSVTVIVVNEGGETVNGIEVSIPQAAGDVFTGGNEYVASQGTYTPYGDQTWTVGSIFANGSASITINYFKTQDNTFLQYAEVSAMDEADTDSTPGNGNGTSAIEDDEGIYPDNDPNDPCNPDVIAPNFTSCPDDMVVQTDVAPTQVSWSVPTITDNCSGIMISGTASSGDFFPAGNTLVTLTGTDVAGNEDNCSFTVTVEVTSDPCNPDVTPPVISNCPDDITVVTPVSPINVSWDEPVATDNCSSPSLISSGTNGGLYFEGTTPVNYNSTDDVGNNAATCTFLITVMLESDPPGTCENNILNDPGFENGFTDWQAIGNAQSTTDAYSGNAAMYANDPGAVRIIQGGDAIAGESYTLSAYSKISDLNGVGRIYIKFLSANYQPLQSFNENVMSLDYQLWTINATAPANSAYYEVGFRKYPGNFEFYADEFCFQGGDVIDPPMEETGCYFEEIYEDVPASVASRSLDAKENMDGSFSLRLFDQSAAFDSSLGAVEVSANGGFESYTSLGALPNPTALLDDGFLNASGSTGNTINVERFQFGVGIIWENDYMIPEASSIDIDGAGQANDGIVLTGKIRQGGIDVVNYPILIRLSSDGDLLGYQIEEALPYYSFVSYFKEASDGYFLRVYNPTSVSTTVVKTDVTGNWLWSVIFSNGFSSALTRISEASDGSVYISLIEGASTVPFAPLSVAEFKRVDHAGNLIWSTNFGLSQGSVEKAAMEAVSGGAVLSYITRLNGVSTFNYKKYDESNSLLWEKTYGDINASIQLQTQDGGLLFAGTDDIGMQGSFQSRPYLLKTTSEGNFLPLCEEDPIMDGPDLTLSNLDAPGNALVGETINYSFTLQNIGDELAAGDFNIKAYFSTDNNLSSDDIFDGLVPTGNIAAGQTINNVGGASVVPNLPNGNFYLILKVDADDDIAESNESNNIITQIITVGAVDPPVEDCDISADFPWHEWISNVKLGSQIDNASGKSSYSDYTSLGPVIAERGGIIAHEITASFSYQTYQEVISIYYDFNQNGIFETSERSSSTLNAPAPGNGATIMKVGTVNVPPNAPLGTFKVRIVLSREVDPGPCGIIDFGEAEDYLVQVVPGGSISAQLQQSQDGEILLYPNPVGEELTIEIAKDLSGAQTKSSHKKKPYLRLKKT